jgi:hypothetical protein
MIITNRLEVIKEKTYDELIIGDKLKRKIDQCFYELINMTRDEYREETVYHFYGFIVIGARNLKHYFVMNNNLFEVY